jgi:Flp pilus assembly protein TadD
MNLENTLNEIVKAIQSSQAHRAELLARDNLLSHPHNESLLVLLALSLQYQQRQQEAVAVYAELIRIHPHSALHWSNYAVALNGLHDLDGAKAAYGHALDLDSSNLTIRDQYGMLLLDRREYSAAREMLLAAHLLDKDAITVRVHAAKACCLCQDFESAAELLRHWRAWLPLGDESLQLELARTLSLRNETVGAAWLLEDLLIHQPDHFEAKLLLATIYERQNRLDDSETLAQQIIDSAENSRSQKNEVEHLLASLALRRRQPERALRLLLGAGAQDDDDAEHYFQLAAVHDKRGDVAATLQALQKAHQISDRLLRIDAPEHFAPGVTALPSEAPRVSAEQYRRWPVLMAPDVLDSPIFVVGFPRSGTTLLEQMLDAHPALQSMDENPFFNRLINILRSHDARIPEDLSLLRQYDCDELRKRYHAMVGERIERNLAIRLVDKNPLNMQWLSMIHRLFPAAKIILAVRHPCDVILSCYMQHFRSQVLATACCSLERLAQAYVDTMQHWLADVQLFKPDVLVSRYEELVDDLAGQAGRIAQYLDIADGGPLMQFDKHARSKSYIGTPSYSQVIEPINRKAIGRWTRYREAFRPVLPILRPMLEYWGYPVE